MFPFHVPEKQVEQEKLSRLFRTLLVLQVYSLWFEQYLSPVLPYKFGTSIIDTFATRNSFQSFFVPGRSLFFYIRRICHAPPARGTIQAAAGAPRHNSACTDALLKLSHTAEFHPSLQVAVRKYHCHHARHGGRFAKIVSKEVTVCFPRLVSLDAWIRTRTLYV
jgi:hypothetical protein